MAQEPIAITIYRDGKSREVAVITFDKEGRWMHVTEGRYGIYLKKSWARILTCMPLWAASGLNSWRVAGGIDAIFTLSNDCAELTVSEASGYVQSHIKGRCIAPDPEFVHEKIGDNTTRIFYNAAIPVKSLIRHIQRDYSFLGAHIESHAEACIIDVTTNPNLSPSFLRTDICYEIMQAILRQVRKLD